MPAARYWRLVGLEAHAGGDLEMSALHVYDASGRVDAGATLTSPFAPIAGSLTALQDEDFGTTVRFSKAAISAPSFSLQWDLGANFDVYGVRASGPTKDLSIKSAIIQSSADGVAWSAVSAALGDFVYLGASALTAAPTEPPWGYSEAATWAQQTDAGARSWRGVSMSADGARMVATAQGGYLHLSRDGGATWEQQTAPGSRNWFRIHMSANGMTILAIPSGANIWVSTDGGVTWAERTVAGSRSWNGSAMSSDGTRMLAGATGSFLWSSGDRGVTWTEQTAAGSRIWFPLAVSPDGTKMVAGVLGGYLYVSSDGGATWVEKTAAGSRNWYSLAVSANGTKMIAGAFNDSLFVSSDGGGTWAARPAPGARGWNALAMSADGMKVLAGAGGSYLYVSGDGGATWAEKTAVGVLSWNGAAASSDGVTMLATETNGFAHLSRDSGATWVQQAAAGSRAWFGRAMSADGSKMLAAADYLFRLFASRDPLFSIPARRASGAWLPLDFAGSPIIEMGTTGLPDAMPWRDMEFAGKGKVVGTVKEKNTPANTPLRRRVRLVREIDGLQTREVWSNATTGAYEFLEIDERYKYSVISYDYATNYRAVIADNLTPELMP